MSEQKKTEEIEPVATKKKSASPDEIQKIARAIYEARGEGGFMANEGSLGNGRWRGRDLLHHIPENLHRVPKKK